MNVEFQGQIVDELASASTIGDHTHTARLVTCAFPDGTVTPFIEVSEHREGYSGRRLVHLSDVVHLLLNVGEMELFEIGNRERDYRGALTSGQTASTHPCCTSESAGTSRRT